MLVDGGSSINLVTAKVLATLQIPFSRLEDTGVFQVVNGNMTRPLAVPGSLLLDESSSSLSTLAAGLAVDLAVAILSMPP